MDDIVGRSLTVEFFYIGEILRWQGLAMSGGYVETTAFAGLKTTLTAKAINGQDNARWRRFYTPDGLEASRAASSAAKSWGPSR